LINANRPASGPYPQLPEPREVQSTDFHEAARLAGSS
jgi:hypothetical protein